MKAILITILLSLFLSGYISTAFSGETAQSLYTHASEEVLFGNWDYAIDLLQELIDRFPESKYHDDALFRIGYCLENMEDQALQAFMTFETLMREFPGSPWVDDARVHRIYVAEALAADGNIAYLTILNEELDSANEEVAARAALSMGTLGDERALPYLNRLKGNAQYGRKAAALYEAIRSDSTATDKNTQPAGRGLSFEASRENRKQKLEEKEKKWGFILPPTQNYKSYRALLRDDNQWTKDELVDFGMWTILEEDAFREYFTYTDYDRSEWLRKYWKQQDPTPTTEENEALREFERRILHARAHYGQVWNAKHLKFLRDQHNRLGWPSAPWDARGELYIKYGEPDYVSPTDFNEEEWIYHGLGIDFIVRKYMTNIYGNALSAGEISFNRYRDELAWFEAKYEYNKEFIYRHNYEADPLKDTEVDIRSVIENNEQVFTFEYRLPFKELRRVPGNSIIQLMEKWVILDEHMNPVREGEQILIHDTGRDKYLSNRFKVRVRPGDFLVVLRLEDTNSDKLGIYKESFEQNE